MNPEGGHLGRSFPVAGNGQVLQAGDPDPLVRGPEPGELGDHVVAPAQVQFKRGTILSPILGRRHQVERPGEVGGRLVGLAVLYFTHLVEVIIGIESRVAEEFVCRAVIGVGARL